MTKNSLQLDQEELEVLKYFEAGKFGSIPNRQGEREELERAARETLRKDKRINIRISSRDLERIQRHAAREGIPYQTYIASTLHKLVAGRLKEVV